LGHDRLEPFGAVEGLRVGLAFPQVDDVLKPPEGIGAAKWAMAPGGKGASGDSQPMAFISPR
jgi:hypothetical protein